MSPAKINIGSPLSSLLLLAPWNIVSEIIWAVVPRSLEVRRDLLSIIRHLNRSFRIACLACERLLGLYSDPIPWSVKRWRVSPYALNAAVPVGHAILMTSLHWKRFLTIDVIVFKRTDLPEPP